MTTSELARIAAALERIADAVERIAPPGTYGDGFLADLETALAPEPPPLYPDDNGHDPMMPAAVCAALGISMRTLSRMESDGRAPESVILGGGEKRPRRGYRRASVAAMKREGWHARA